jgi:zinc protease
MRQRETFGPDFGRMIRRAIYSDDHPFGREEASLSELQAIELRHAQWFFQTWYRPDNAVLAVVGDVEPRAAFGLVERYFGPIESPPWPVKRKARAAVRLPRVRLLSAEAPLDHDVMAFVWVSPRAAAEQNPALEIAHYVLTHRLRAILTDAESLAGSVTSQRVGLGAELVFSLDVALEPGADPAAVTAHVVSEVSRVRSEAVRPVELNEARSYAGTSLVLEIEDLLARAKRYASSTVSVQEALGSLLAVNARSVQLAARKHLSLRSRLVALLTADAHAPLEGNVVRIRDVGPRA